MLREKRESEDRINGMYSENQVLQGHLEKTAMSAQEVSN